MIDDVQGSNRVRIRSNEKKTGLDRNESQRIESKKDEKIRQANKKKITIDKQIPSLNKHESIDCGDGRGGDGGGKKRI